MDTLVSLGVSAAYLWSLVTLVVNPGEHPREHGHYYFETAAVVTAFKPGDTLTVALRLHRPGPGRRHPQPPAG